MESMTPKDFAKIKEFLDDRGVQAPAFKEFVGFSNFYLGEQPQRWGMDTVFSLLTGYSFPALLAKVFFEHPGQVLSRWQTDLGHQIMRPAKW